MSITALSHSVLPDGQDVALFPVPSELTVAQAALVIGVPADAIEEMLDDDMFEHRRVGGRRLIDREGLIAYKQESDRRHAALDEMVLENQEMGFYD